MSGSIKFGKILKPKSYLFFYLCPMRWTTLYKWIATFFGSGYFPKGPGTAGAALATLIWYLMFCRSSADTFIFQTLLIIVATILGTWATGHLEKEWGKDPSRIVIDEAVGVWIGLLVVPCDWRYILTAFVLFRFFDILKPLGIRKMENIGGAFGVMLDDILAGIYTLILMAVFIHFNLLG